MDSGCDDRSVRQWRIFALAILLVFGGSGAALAAPLVTFEWVPSSETVLPGTTSITVTLHADQSGGADAAGITLGFALADGVTDITLDSYGSAVSTADSFFGLVGGNLAMIAVAPFPPGSYGVDTDFDIATFTLTLDSNLYSGGSVSLTDLTNLLGSPVLKADGFTEIQADLSAVYSIEFAGGGVSSVPEPKSVLLFASALLLFAALRSRSTLRRC